MVAQKLKICGILNERIFTKSVPKPFVALLFTSLQNKLFKIKGPLHYNIYHTPKKLQNTIELSAKMEQPKCEDYAI